MALRVLLADESSTIKKVFQLALQDYGVEVRSVNVGIDVVAVAKQFSPDIVFADVLLQKRSGYDVSADLRSDPELRQLPVVLMWSGFMELDEDKYEASGANSHLEKPFDVQALREVIQRLVPKTKTQRLSRYLTHPPTPEIEVERHEQPKLDERDGPPPLPTTTTTSAGLEAVDNSAASSTWNMENFESIEQFSPPEEEFQELNLPATEREEPTLESSDESLLTDESDEEDAAWVRTNLSRFHMDINADEESEELAVDYVVPDEKIDGEELLRQRGKPTAMTAAEPETIERDSEPTHASASDSDSYLELDDMDLSAMGGDEIEVESAPVKTEAKTQHAESAQPTQLSSAQLEEIIRSQSQEVIESVVWKIVPDLAKQIIERELQRLLDEKEKLKP